MAFEKKSLRASALARARVKHEAVPSGAVSPVFRTHIGCRLSRMARRVQTRAQVARPFRRVIPLHAGRPCPCYPGLTDGQGCSAALRFNLRGK